MHRTLRRILGTAAVGVGLGSAPALAQDAISIDNAGDATPREKLAYVSTAIEEMQLILKGESRLRERATKAGTPEDVACVDNAMSTVKLLKSVSERAQADLTEALAGSNAQRAEHEFRKVVVAASRAREMQSEASSCAGEDAALAGDLSVQVQNDALAEGDDTRSLTEPDALIGEVNPPQGSPWQ